MRDEDKFPTVRFHKCKACGHVYTGSLTGDNACPACHAPAQTAIAQSGSIAKSAEGPHALLTITGSLHKIQDLEDLRAHIDATLGTAPESIAFAFRKASYLNSSLVNLLVKTMQTLSVHGKPTYIITEEIDVLESLQMMDLDRVMRIYPTLEQYRAALS